MSTFFEGIFNITKHAFLIYIFWIKYLIIIELYDLTAEENKSIKGQIVQQFCVLYRKMQVKKFNDEKDVAE